MNNHKLVNDTHNSFIQNGLLKQCLTQDEFNQKNEELRNTIIVFSTLIEEYLRPHWYNFGQYQKDTITGIKKGNWDLSLQFKPSNRTRNMLFENSEDLFSYLLMLLKKRKPKMYLKFLQRFRNFKN